MHAGNSACGINVTQKAHRGTVELLSPSKFFRFPVIPSPSVVLPIVSATKSQLPRHGVLSV